MDKYIGFDIDSKKTIACVVQRGKKDRFTTLKTDINRMKDFLNGQRRDGEKLHLAFEISGEAGYRHDALINLVDSITVSNPTRMTWIYRTAKKNDRIDSHKQAVPAYTDDIRRFGRSKQTNAYFGLTPRLDESGSVRRLGHISKQGPSVVRWLVVEAAWRAIRKSPGLRAFYERVMCGQAGRKKIAIVAVARKLVARDSWFLTAD